MSIWNECEEYNAMPFYGFPVKPFVKDGFIIFEFPIGYDPNGSQTKEVAAKLRTLCGKKHKDNVVTTKMVKIKLDENKLAILIYNGYLNKH